MSHVVDAILDLQGAVSDAHTWDVTLARTAEDAARERDAWLAMPGLELTSHPDRVLALPAIDLRLDAPLVVRLDRDGAPCAMAVGWLGPQRLTVKLGPRTVHLPELRSFTLAGSGLLAPAEDEIVERLVDAVASALARGEADVALFRRLPVGSHALGALERAAGSVTRDHASPVTRVWETELPDSLDAFYAQLSSKTRLSLRNRAHRIEREFGDALVVDVYREPSHLDALLADIEAVAATTYQRALHRGFRADERQRALTKLGLEHDWVRAYVLKLDGRPVAYVYGEGWNGRYRPLYPGYDPEFRRFGVGNYVLLRAIDDLCREGRTRILDFGAGDTETKKHFASPTAVRDYYLFAPRGRAVGVNVARTGAKAATNGYAWLLSQARFKKLQERLPRSWRPGSQRRSRSAG